MMCANPCNAVSHAKRLHRLKKWLVLETAIAGGIIWGATRREVWSATGLGWNFWFAAVGAVAAVFAVPAAGIWLVRHRFQFSLKVLLLLVLVAGVGCARLSSWLQQTRKQRDVVAMLAPRGAGASYPGEEEPGFRTLIGQQYFRSPVGLSVARGFQGGDAAMISALTDLRSLTLASPNVSDDDLIHLARLTRLNWLCLRDTNVRGPGLKHVARLPQLVSLDLAGSAVTDEGLTNLRLRRLRHLYLGSTEIGDQGVAAISTLPDLKTLDLSQTKITDDGLKWLGQMRTLEELHLAYDKVTDVGLAYLQDLDQLMVLDVRRTAVTESGINALRNRLPNCMILTEPQPELPGR